MNVTLKQADTIITAALAEARNRNAKAMAVLVLDSGGHPVAYRREDGASLFRHDIARAKAMGALGMGCDTRVLAERAAGNPTFFNSLAIVANGNLAFSPGGVLIRSSDGDILGAVGVSGDTAAMDEACAAAGISAAELQHGANS